MRRILSASLCVGLVGLIASHAAASDAIVRLSGWAEIPSTYRHPSPQSGHFQAPVPDNGVTQPYSGQPIPGFSGIIPSGVEGTFIGLPDNGFGAQNNSADFVIGFYTFVPTFKDDGDGTTARGRVEVKTFTPFRDPEGAGQSVVHHWWPCVPPPELLSDWTTDSGRPGHPERALADGR